MRASGMLVPTGSASVLQTAQKVGSPDFQASEAEEAAGTPRSASALGKSPSSPRKAAVARFTQCDVRSESSSREESPLPMRANCKLLFTSPDSSFREADLQLEREERDQDTHLKASERCRFESEVKSLEQTLMARRHTLENAQGLVHERTQLVQEEAAQIRSMHENDHRTLLASAQREAAYWQAEFARMSSAVQMLEGETSKEAIRTEQLRNCSLNWRAKCVEMERAALQHRDQRQNLTAELASAEQRMLFCTRQGEQEQGLAKLKQTELEGSLQAVLFKAGEMEECRKKQFSEVSARRERESKCLKVQFEKRSAAISAAIDDSKRESEESARRQLRRPMSSRQSRALHPDVGVRAAALRSQNYRKTEEDLHELRALQSELFQLQKLLEIERLKPGPSKTELSCELHAARQQFETAEEIHEQVARREADQEVQLHKLHECRMQLEEQHADMETCFTTLGMAAMRKPEHNTAHALSEQIAEIRGAAALMNLRSGKTMSRMWEEHDTQMETMRRTELNTLMDRLEELRTAHRQTLATVTKNREVAIYSLQEELEEEGACSANGIPKWLGEKLRWELSHRLQKLAQDQQQYLMHEALAQRRALQGAFANAENVEKTYLRLRKALLEAHEDAERQHAVALEEQAAKLREFTALSGSLPYVSGNITHV